jgi:hypothetical protein
MRYRVYCGSWHTIFDTREAAEEAALVQARMYATADGLDPDTVAIYDLRSRGGDWGACPDGDEGGYYPKIEEMED